MLAYVDYTQPFWVYVVGNLQGQRAVLAQVQNGQERVIAYASQSLQPTEKNPDKYSSFKLELLPWFWVIIQKFVEYLMGADI